MWITGKMNDLRVPFYLRQLQEQKELRVVSSSIYVAKCVFIYAYMTTYATTSIVRNIEIINLFKNFYIYNFLNEQKLKERKAKK